MNQDENWYPTANPFLYAIHCQAIDLIAIKIPPGSGSSLLKITLFLAFRNNQQAACQKTNLILLFVAPPIEWPIWSYKWSMCRGKTVCIPNHLNTWFQIADENGQERNIWFLSSTASLQKEQDRGRFRMMIPRFCNYVAVGNWSKRSHHENTNTL